MHLNLSTISSWPEWVACTLVIAAVIFGKKSRWISGAAILAVLALVWHLGTAKSLLLPVVFGVAGWLVLSRKESPWRKVGDGLAVSGSLATAVLCWLFPLPVPPLLAGHSGVGTINIELPLEDGLPKLLIQIWYPSDQIGKSSPVKWLPDSDLAPAFPHHRIAYAMANARHGVPPLVRKGLFTVIFYEHSWMGHRAENVMQVESLASQGFVVVAMDHPGQAARTRYADGTVVLARYAELLDLTSLKGVAAFEATAQRCFNERMSNVERVRVALKGDVAGRLKGRLNLDRVGVFGFSFGGSNALRLCSQNPAFHAGANEDGLFLGEEMPAGPFLFFDQEMPSWLLDPPSGEEDAEQSLIRRAEAHIQEAMHQSGRERVVLDGTRHLSFSDRIYTSPFPRLARVGRRSAEEVHEVLCTRLYKFFTAALGSSGQLEQTGGAE